MIHHRDTARPTVDLSVQVGALTLKNRGVRDTFFVVCDGLEGCPRSS